MFESRIFIITCVDAKKGREVKIGELKKRKRKGGTNRIEINQRVLLKTRVKKCCCVVVTVRDDW